MCWCFLFWFNNFFFFLYKIDEVFLFWISITFWLFVPSLSLSLLLFLTLILSSKEQVFFLCVYKDLCKKTTEQAHRQTNKTKRVSVSDKQNKWCHQFEEHRTTEVLVHTKTTCELLSRTRRRVRLKGYFLQIWVESSCIF